MLGMVTFWTTRVSAIFEAYFAAELLLSGRLVPVSTDAGVGAGRRRRSCRSSRLRLPDHRAGRPDLGQRAVDGLLAPGGVDRRRRGRRVA